MTGKHGAKHSPSSRGTTRAGTDRAGTVPAGVVRLRMAAAARWRQLTGSASATALAFCLLACGCALVAVAGPRAGAQLRNNAYLHLVADTPAGERTVVGTLDAATLGTAVNAPVDAAQIGYVQATLRHHLARALPLASTPGSDWAGLTTAFAGFADHSREVGGLSTKLELAYRSNLGKNVRLVAGSLPGGGPRGTLQVAVTAATAKRFNLAVGTIVPMPSTGIRLRVTGIVVPAGPAGPFWQTDPTVAVPSLGFLTGAHGGNAGPPFWQGGAFVAGGALPALDTHFNTTALPVTWMFGLALDRLTAAQAVQLSNSLPGVLSTSGLVTFPGQGTSLGVSLTSGATYLLGVFASQDGAVGNVLSLMAVSLAVVGASVVLLTAWLMAEKRREEFAVLRARGASRRQLGIAALWYSAIAGVPGTAVGIALGVALTPGSGSVLSWWLAGLTILVALAGPVLITVRLHRGYASATRPDRPASRIWSVRRLILEVALALGSIGGLIVLRDQGVGPGGADLYASAAPVLAAIPVAIIMLRLYPLLVRLLARQARRQAGVTAFLGLARAARVSATAVLPAFAMVLALSLVSFAGMVRGAVIRGEVAQSWRQAGADAVIGLPAALTAAQQHAVGAVPGVQRSVPIALSVGRRGQSAGAVTVVVADPAQYAALLADTPSGRPPARFGNWHGAATSPRRPVPVLGSPGLAAQFGRGPVGLLLGDGQNIVVQVSGSAPAMSAIPEIVAQDVTGYIVLPRSALGARAPAPTAMLVVGPGLDDGALTAAVAAWHSRGSVVTLRSNLLAALEQAPLQRGAYAELAVGAAAAAVGCMLVLLLTLMLSAQSRQMTLARAATMGMSSAQGRWLTLIEALPQILSALIGGLICALALARLVGPTLGLSVFTGSAAAVPIGIEPAGLTATAIGLLVLAIATLTGQTVLASRGAPRSLRIGG
jgi:putative ABC transport system permease protein